MKKIFIPLFLNKFDEKKQNFANFVVIFVKLTSSKKQKRRSIEDSKTNKKHMTLFVPESTSEALQCTPFASAKITCPTLSNHISGMTRYFYIKLTLLAVFNKE